MDLCPRTVLITGASSGLGLEYVKQMINLKNPPEIIVAASRNPDRATELQQLATTLASNSTIKIVKLDVECDEDIELAFQATKEAVGELGLNLLINNAAIYDRSNSGSLILQTREKMQKHFNVNVTSPVLIVQKFLPLLKQAATTSKGFSCSKAGVVMMSSRVGSQQIVFDDEPGASLSLHYKCSKSALNMATIMISRELKDDGILVFAIHPGWAKTRMGTDRAPLQPSESVQSCLNVIGTAGEALHGKLVTLHGEILPY
ncbi:uncharacterized protein LOC131927114 [Physella acuta]|uniref:uncharacterized protein LOC131927114 n=1 Tax=Physella acuta TaxID=109671 RepID=UPI0027DB0955|nr:uncharacterized protein LOC131927114 [Physella acuta]